MAKLSQDQLLEAFASMNVLELADFKKAFEDKFGVTAAAPAAAAAAVAAAPVAVGPVAASRAAIWSSMLRTKAPTTVSAGATLPSGEAGIERS